MPPVLECLDIRKRYGASGPYGVGSMSRGVDLLVEKGELFAVIGPSGCGKSSLLRIIGGFIEATTGQVLIAGRNVTTLPPHSRPTNMVFQNYALFPHMTIGGNISFGLEMEGIDRVSRERRVREALELVGLSGFRDRYVGELSGGQLQRAALARALVKRPAILLLDEPLGALDLQLRRQMQDEIVRLKLALGTTIVHVTHDQEEACAIADKIAVLRDGVVLQIAEPFQLYRNPATAFVAEFINAGTILRGQVSVEGRSLRLAGPGITVAGSTPVDGFGTTAVAGLIPRRGAAVRLAAPGEEAGLNQLLATIVRMSFTGTDYGLTLETSSGLSVALYLPVETVVAAGLTPGAKVLATWQADDIRFVEDDAPDDAVQTVAA